MASIVEILPFFWPTALWRMDNASADTYANLVWDPASPVPRPSEAEIRSHSAEVDVLVAARDRKSRQQRALIADNNADYLLAALETIINGMAETHRVIQDMRTTILASAHTGSWTAWDSAVVNKMTTLRARIQDIRDNI